MSHTNPPCILLEDIHSNQSSKHTTLLRILP